MKLLPVLTLSAIVSATASYSVSQFTNNKTISNPVGIQKAVYHTPIIEPKVAPKSVIIEVNNSIPVNQTTITSTTGNTYIIKKENITCNSTKAVWVDGFMMLDNTTTCSAAGVKVDLTGKKTHYYENKLCISGKAVLNYIPCSAAKDFNMI